MKHIKESILEISLSVSAIISFVPIINFISIIIFTINFFTLKKRIIPSITFFSVAIFMNILYFYTKPYFDEIKKDFQKPGFDSRFAKVSINKITHFNNLIVKFKKTHGHYPEDLSEIQNEFTTIEDLSYNIRIDDDHITFESIYYEKLDSLSYYLLCVGPDGKPKTNDDLLPIISKSFKDSTGLVKFTIE